jgi:hypothetical protein
MASKSGWDRFLSFFDYNGRKFHFFVNGEPQYKTFWGGIIILLCYIFILVVSINFTIDFFCRRVFDFNVYTGNINYTSLSNLNKKTYKVYINYSIDNSSLQKEFEDFYNLAINGKRIDGSNATTFNNYKNNNETSICIDLYDYNHTSQIFISNNLINDTNDQNYQEFLKNDLNIQFEIKLEHFLINPYDEDIENNVKPINKSITFTLNKERGVNYFIDLSRNIVIKDTNWFWNDKNTTEYLSYDNIFEIDSTQDNIFEDYVFSIAFFIPSEKIFIFNFKYQKLTALFSSIGGFANFVSLIWFFKKYFSLFDMDMNLINTRFKKQTIIEPTISYDDCNFAETNNENTKPFKASTTSIFYKSLEKEDKRIKKLTYFDYLKYKYCSCRKKNRNNNVYETYKNLFSVDYFIRAMIQLKLMKELIFTKSQIAIIDSISKYDRIDFTDDLNIYFTKESFIRETKGAMETYIKNEHEERESLHIEKSIQEKLKVLMNKKFTINNNT